MTTRITTDNITDGTIAAADLSNLPNLIDWQAVKTSNFTAAAGEGYFVNTTGGVVTLTLPASATVGDTITVHDYAGTFDTNSLTIDRNGHKINAVENNGTVGGENASITLVYVDTTQGWRTISNSTPDGIAPAYISATGGTESTSGNYKIHVFNSSSNFVVTTVGNSGGGGAAVSYAVVGGGGGGGQSNGGGGGGGAGGYREGKSPADSYTSPFPGVTSGGITLSASTTYPITVGGGGTGGTGPGSGSPGNDGSASVFSTITSSGGGGGGGTNGGGACSAGRAGASGGGGGRGGPPNSSPGGNGNTPPVSPPQGNSGGNGTEPNSGGGGGGAAAAGANASGGTAGTGGAGAVSEISGSSVTRGGGGGGNSEVNGSSGAGGAGGGGNGAGYPGVGQNTKGLDGGTNLGGGGGGGDSPIGPTGATGGSGVVILRYKYQN